MMTDRNVDAFFAELCATEGAACHGYGIKTALQSAARGLLGIVLAMLLGSHFDISRAATALSEAAPSDATARATDASSTGELTEIIVTAEKRSTNLQTTPIAITALNRAALEENQVRNLEDIQALVPSFKAGDSQGVAQFTIRGIGTSALLAGSEGAVAVNLNNIYISRTVAQLSGLFDVSQVEVLRGPQGTLYGRNATAGAVNITTTLPTNEFSGYARLTGGNYGEARFEGAVGGPLIDNILLVRLAAFGERHDGYGTNLATGTGIDDKGAYGFRGTFLFTPTSEITATLFTEYYKENDHGMGFHYFGSAGLSGLPGALGVPPVFVSEGGYSAHNITDIANGIDPQFYLRTGAVTAILDWHPGGPFSLKSITGYRDQQAFATYPSDGGSVLGLYVIQGEPAHQISQEFDAHADLDKLQLTGGVYYFHENDDALPVAVPTSTSLLTRAFGVPYPTSYFVNFASFAALLSTQAEAAFVQGTYQLTPKLSLTAGVRYSVEKKEDTALYAIDLTTPYTGNNALPTGVQLPSKDFYSTTPRFGIQYQLDPRTLLYATYAQGFKAGGFDTAVQNPVPYQPEHLTDYEGGVKTTMLDGHLRANIAAYYYKYTNLQVQQVVGITVQTGNAATAKDYGVEGELTYLMNDAFQIDATASYMHARYNQYAGADAARPLIPSVDFSGNALNNAPDFQADLSPQYTWRMRTADFILRAEVEYSSRFYFSPANLDFLSQGSYAKESLFASYRTHKNWEATAYIKNISDRRTKTSATVNTPLVGNPVQGSLSPPRLAGVELQYKF